LKRYSLAGIAKSQASASGPHRPLVPVGDGRLAIPDWKLMPPRRFRFPRASPDPINAGGPAAGRAQPPESLSFRVGSVSPFVSGVLTGNAGTSMFIRSELKCNSAAGRWIGRIPN